MNPEALINPETDSGVPGGDLLLAFSDAIVGTDRAALDHARDALEQGLGKEAVAGAVSIAANFSKNDRVANGLGIPVDEMVMKGTKELRAELRLNEFRTAINTFRHYGD